jgi:putative peptidoglycan lipid II flippase
MVKRIFSLFNKEFNDVNEAALLLALFSFLSQFLGLLRDRTLTSSIGPSETLDIYYAAFRIPDLLYVSIASLASVTVILPFLVEHLKGEDGLKKAKKFFDGIFTVISGALIIISVGLFIAMPLFATLIVPGFTDTARELFIQTSRIMLLSPIIFGISNLLGSVTQLFRKFFIYALCPVFYNLGILIGVLFLYPSLGLTGLAVGVIFGCVLHLLVQLPTIIRHGFLPRFTFHIPFKELKKVSLLSIPRTLALAFSNITMLVLVAFMSKLGEGAVSVFTLSYNLQTIPTMIVGISYSVASFPILVNLFGQEQKSYFINHVVGATRNIIFWSLPVMILFIVLRAHIVRVAFGAGAFTWNDTRLVAAALAIFAVSVLAQSLIYLLVRAFYAGGETRIPLIVNAFSSVLTIALAVVLTHAYTVHSQFRFFTESLLRVDEVVGTTVLMIPLAYSIGMIANVLLLFFIFGRKFPAVYQRVLGRSLFQVFATSFFMGVASYIMLQFLSPFFNQDHVMGIFFQGFLSGSVGIIIGILMLMAFKNQEFIELRATLSRKFWKTKTVIQEQQDL